jgi:hypothetical protein
MARASLEQATITHVKAFYTPCFARAIRAMLTMGRNVDAMMPYRGPHWSTDVLLPPLPYPPNVTTHSISASSTLSSSTRTSSIQFLANELSQAAFIDVSFSSGTARIHLHLSPRSTHTVVVDRRLILDVLDSAWQTVRHDHPHLYSWLLHSYEDLSITTFDAFILSIHTYDVPDRSICTLIWRCRKLLEVL